MTSKMEHFHDSVEVDRGPPKSASSSGKRRKRSNGRGMTGFTSYFRRKKQKELERKELERQLAEERLRELLQPGMFSQDEESRLRELKQHKRWKRIQLQQHERNRELKAKAMPVIPETRIVSLEEGRVEVVEEETMAQRTMSSFHEHSWGQRIAVVSTLMLLLFLSLHADTWSKQILPERVFLDSGLVPWYIIVLKDWGTFCHMSSCALIHFALCDVSLIYAFESVDLATKTGPRVKQFYREKVHLAVAAVSGGIVALSICKALVLAWFRMLRELVETAMDLFSAGIEACTSCIQSIVRLDNLFKLLGFLKNTVVSVLTTPPSQWISSAYAGLARSITGLCIWVLAILIPFDANERTWTSRMISLTQHSTLSEKTMTATRGAVSPQVEETGEWWSEGNVTDGYMIDEALTTTLNAATISVGDDEPVRWSEDAFETCRSLLSHSAVFLVTLLVSMNFLTSRYKHREDKKDNETQMAAAFRDDHSSIQTTLSLANDETALLGTNCSTDTSMETLSTAAVRPATITVTIAAEPSTSEGVM